MQPLVAISRLAPTLVICQFIYFLFSLSMATEVFRFNVVNLGKEIIFAMLNIFVLANFFYFFFEAPLVNLLMSQVLNKKMYRRPIALEVNNNEMTVKKNANSNQADTSS